MVEQAAHLSWPADAGFSVNAVYTADEVRIVPCGELDIAARPQLEALLGELAFPSLSRVVVDLRTLEFIDSTGVSLVLELAKAAREHNTDLLFLRGSHAVQRVLAISGIEHTLTFVEQLD
ncbi:STAS domain-containing protein [Solirubrobacter soli]|uniref:STAS domain-containing protein n=1 Tax=Solirubrobacter soli TaxID=363832 RepID=UPI0003FEB617|nr:STAS domain-containing protein [Solirubrobacter soli]